MVVVIEEAAQEYARKKHGQAMRRNAPAIDHVQSVVSNLRAAGVDDSTIICAGWLHDTIEDGDTDYDDIYDQFGRDVADCVSVLSKDKRLPKEERDRQYADQLAKASWQAQVVKLADILANLQSIADTGQSTAKLQKKATKLRSYLLAIRGGITPSRVPGLPTIQKRLDLLLMLHGLEPVPLGGEG